MINLKDESKTYMFVSILKQVQELLHHCNTKKYVHEQPIVCSSLLYKMSKKWYTHPVCKGYYKYIKIQY